MADEYKKGDIITVNFIPANVDPESSLITNAELVIPNKPPVITSEPPTEITGEKKLFEYEVQTEDPDGDEVEIKLKKSPKGMKIEPATGLIEWDFTEVKPGSEFTIEIIATDTDGASYTQTVTLSIPQDGEGEKKETPQEGLKDNTEDLETEEDFTEGQEEGLFEEEVVEEPQE